VKAFSADAIIHQAIAALGNKLSKDEVKKDGFAFMLIK
jgi:hypothetical protein